MQSKRHLAEQGREADRVARQDRQAHRGRDVAYLDITQTEARTLDAGSWKDPKFKGEKIPLLEEQIASIPPGKRMLVEIKTGPEMVSELARVLKQCARRKRTSRSSASISSR
jgi:glycerophosphoryl diester phosphodiesterase